ncbi:MAG TPA: hypothetical protein VLB27_05680, partial [candidate division Zixibacteria bacterium]|nr:hypothetical protein [candidate division Zixibacteria bacterium]
ERLSIYNPFLQMTVNQDNAPIVAGRAKRLDNGELFARISGYFGATEWALYGYNGFFPQPLGVRMAGGPAGAPVLFAPQLSAVGASARGQLSSLLVNAEGAVYLSEDDSDGADPSLPNSALKALVGVERSLGGETTVSGQWFGDLTLDYDAYAEPFISAGGTAPVAELRHTVTLRVTKLMLYQTVKLSFFGYWGISDEDYYLRPSIEYDYTDNLQITLGANWLGGDHPYTMFGQFRDNSNLYLRLRRSF